MALLVINAGSSSVKFTLFREDARTVDAAGIVERIGSDGTRLKYRGGGQTLSRPVRVANADEAVGCILAALTHKEYGAIDRVDRIRAVGHRVVHGGERLTRPVVVDPGVKAYLSECARFAPLHNPHHIKGIEACERHMPHAVQVAVFDTAFHATIPQHAFLYGIPLRYYAEDHVRRYGFHGISHKYVSEAAARLLGVPIERLRMVTCHLGNGCSMTAVQGGRSVDTTMGFTPLEGLVMGTRSGDIDPAAVLFIMEQHRIGPAAMNTLLNKQSGMLALSGTGSHDLRDVLAAAESGSPQATVALDVFCYRVRKTIGAFAAVMGGLDAVVFTAGIGENSPHVRERVCAGLESPDGFGLRVDPLKNREPSRHARTVHADGSRVRVLVVPTDEEQEIAREMVELLTSRA